MSTYTITSETFDPCVGCDEICGGLMNCTEKKLFEAIKKLFEAMQADIDVRDKVITKLERDNEVLKEALGDARGWMEANIPEMECRGDDDCDHCLGASIYRETGQALSKIRSEG